MTDPLAGMTVAEAREWVEAARKGGGPLTGTQPWEAILALAALGAECVGAKKGWAGIVFDTPERAMLSYPKSTLTRVLVLKEDK